MSFEPVWGAPIAWYLFLAGLGGGAFITSAFLRWKHPEAHGMRFAGHIIAPVVVIIGLFLLMFDAEAGLHNPLRFALLLHNPCSVMTWGVVFLAAFVIIALITLLLDCLKKQVPAWLEIAGSGVCGMRWRIHGRFARRVPDVPAVEQRFAADSVLGFGGFHGHVFGAACGRPEVPQGIR